MCLRVRSATVSNNFIGENCSYFSHPLKKTSNFDQGAYADLVKGQNRVPKIMLVRVVIQEKENYHQVQDVVRI